jgi:uncharacterized membrane protein (UPF0127 family)
MICFNGLYAQNTNLTKIPIRLGDKILYVELADTPEKQAHGLMFRTTIKKNEGMLFVFPTERKRTFWMKNTFIPLSIGFFDGNRILVDVQQMKPVRSIVEVPSKRYVSAKPAKYALEVSLGWFEENGVKKGTRFSFIDGE